MLFLPHLKLLWHWGIGRCLKLLNLVSAEAGVIENLPLLWLALVSINLALDLLGLANDLLNPVLELDEHLLHPWGVLESGSASVLPR